MATQLIENDAVTDKRMRDFAQSLSEIDRRRFAAIEAVQQGFGGSPAAQGMCLALILDGIVKLPLKTRGVEKERRVVWREECHDEAPRHAMGAAPSARLVRWKVAAGHYAAFR